MAIYAIGDIQGCYDEMVQLLDFIAFDEKRDRLWFAGDLVNRGPKSLETVRFVRRLGDAAITVLGNHDLHLLACANGNVKRLKDQGLMEFLRAEDSEELLYWLQHRPLLHRDEELGYALIHAGLPPQWDLPQAESCAREVEAVLADERAKDYFKLMYGNEPCQWQESLKGMDRYRFITNCLTRLRYCDPSGRLALKEKGPPGTQSKGYLPWFLIPGRRSRDDRIIFGHWSTLGYQHARNAWAIDSGCLWGGKLTAVRIDNGDPEPRQIKCRGAAKPGE
ncbi:MAG: symmetrical bis(5'-nucleosyl)-tetraphosphatase [Gammaproteobacteria bacterium]|nr:symmetrical bis(5'-nucleosyl)-tetraphosphatase [Gammaproteobacteria bacterium]MBU1653685.1 symmetrical bis(5'-nucleosyl)-tetraphosphatase [Gammaproteobacteria bacterium]MBU1962515.1 symmetrical bis(5'-nucleosyl)-tetraphosphatase [Gammaproteobacteria bacterium]